MHSGGVYWLCLRVVRNPAEAEDLTQEVFLHAFQKMHQFQGRAAFSTWLHRVAVNVVLMQLRKKSHPTASLEEILSSEKSDERSRSSLATIDTSLAGAIDRVLLAQAIVCLPSRYKLAFTLRDVEGYPHREIALRMRCSIAKFEVECAASEVATSKAGRQGEKAEKLMDAKKLKVLLIGKSQGRYSPLSNRLRRRECDCRFATSSQEVRLLLDSHSFDLMLGPIRLNGDSLYPLIGLLGGSRTTLFYSQAVEDGYWWLPALRRGMNCFGAPAIRPSQFVTVLDETIEEIRFSTCVAPETQPAIASRLSGSIGSVSLSRRVSLPVIAVGAQSPSLVARKALG